MKDEGRKWTAWIRALTGFAVLLATAAHAVPLTSDLATDGHTAEKDCKPLLLEFSSTTCSYCRVLEREVLNPTLLNHSYDRRVLMRKLVVDDSARLTDFDGSSEVSGEQLASRYKVFVTPTLVFVDSQGTELAKRMVGVTTLDFYGGYLDQALDDARKILRARPACRQ